MKHIYDAIQILFTYYIKELSEINEARNKHISFIC